MLLLRLQVSWYQILHAILKMQTHAKITSHLLIFNLIPPHPLPCSDYLGQFGTFLFPLKCGVGNGKLSIVSKVPKKPWHYTNKICSCWVIQALWSGFKCQPLWKLHAYFFYTRPDPEHALHIDYSRMKVWWSYWSLVTFKKMQIYVNRTSSHTHLTF